MQRIIMSDLLLLFKNYGEDYYGVRIYLSYRRMFNMYCTVLVRSTRYGVRVQYMLYRELIKNAYKSDIIAQLISLQNT